MDGNHGDVCNYTIHVTQGSTQVPPLAPTGGITGVTETCLSSIETYTVPINEGATFYQWTLDGAIVGNGLSQEINWNTPGLHQLCVSAYNVCDTATPSCMFVQVFPPQNTNLNPGICSGDCFEVADTFLCYRQL